MCFSQFVFARRATGRYATGHGAPMDSTLNKQLKAQIEALKILVVDDDQHMRKVVRTMLAAIGARKVFEAGDAMAGLEIIRHYVPDLVIVDWEMPMIDGIKFVRMVRSPGDFPVPDVPIIMLTGHADRWRVLEAARAGAHEFLLKPVSTKVLQDRIMAILGSPRPLVMRGGSYGPAPREQATLKRDIAAPPEEVGPDKQVVMVN
jgi:two-component system chemotaxis response regulator CheY